MDIRLTELQPNESVDIYNMVKEIGPGENGFVNSLNVANFERFQEEILRNYDGSRGLNLSEHHVPQTIYWLYINERVVGYGKLRHHLNKKLMQHGGHIGYVIRPTERRKGYGKIMLEQLIEKAKEKNIHQLLLTCNEDNYASRIIIERNQGQLAELSNRACKYWIQVG